MGRVQSTTSNDRVAARGGKRTLICFSHLRWNHVYQRPQHLLTRASETYEVYFIEEPVVDASVATPRFNTSAIRQGLTILTPLLPSATTPALAVSAQKALVEGLVARLGRVDLTTWYYTPAALEFTDHLQPDLCVFDNMDELAAFRGAPKNLRSAEDRLFRTADLVFVGGRSLFEANKHRHENIHYFPSSLDAAHFRKARSIACGDPEDQAVISYPRIGFFGVIDERMDMPLVAEISCLRPSWQFVMLGPTAKIDPGDLPRARNIHWLGKKEYQDLPTYLSGWTAGMMPFAINEATRFISPTKTPEFLAAGLPLVSSPVPDVVDPYGVSGLVRIAGTPQTFVTAIEDAIAGRSRAWLQAVDDLLVRSSWNSTWENMQQLMELTQARTAAKLFAPASKDGAFLALGN